MEVILYSTGCPQCNVITKKLESKGIEFLKNDSVDDMLALGINTVPVLSVDGKLLSFSDAVKWVNER